MSDVDRLERFPALVREVTATLSDSAIRTRPEGGGFAMVEQGWHLADLEVEGYTLRMARLLQESDPVWPDFDGDAVARERRYIELDLESALRRFTTARLVNVRRLRNLSEAEWNRSGTQDGVGRVTLARLMEMMAEHDASHAGEIAELLRQMGIEVPRALEEFELPLEETA